MGPQHNLPELVRLEGLKLEVLREEGKGGKGVDGGTIDRPLSYKYSSVPPIVSLNPETIRRRRGGTRGLRTIAWENLLFNE